MGTIQKLGGQAINNTLIIVTYYDSTGTIICVGSLRKMPSSLENGETYSFHIKLYPGMCDLSMIKSYKLMVGRLGY